MKQLQLDMDYYGYKRQGIRTTLILASIGILYFLLDFVFKHLFSKATFNIELLQIYYSLFIIASFLVAIGLTISIINLAIKLVKLLYFKAKYHFTFSREECALLSPFMSKEFKFDYNDIDKIKLELKGTSVTLYLDIKYKSKISRILLGKKKYCVYLTLNSYKELKNFLIKQNNGIALIIKENGKEIFKVAS